MLSTVRICFSRPESEVIAAYLMAKGIPALVSDRQYAAQASDQLVAIGGLRVQVPSAVADNALALLSSVPKHIDLAESRSFRRHPVFNAVVTVLLFYYAGFAYFPFWVRSQMPVENAVRRTPPT